MSIISHVPSSTILPPRSLLEKLDELFGYNLGMRCDNFVTSTLYGNQPGCASGLLWKEVDDTRRVLWMHRGVFCTLEIWVSVLSQVILKTRTWRRRTFFPWNPLEENIAACPLMGPSLNEDEIAALYPDRWADWSRTICFN